MENSFNNRDFERFVKQNADQYRMFPSEKVWGEIHATLHTRRRRWYALGLALLLLTTSVVTWVMLIPGGKNQVAAHTIAAPSAYALAASSPEITMIDKNMAAGPVRTKESYNPFINTPGGVQQSFLTAGNSDQDKRGSNIEIPEISATGALTEITTLNAPAPGDDKIVAAKLDTKMAPRLNAQPPTVTGAPVSNAAGSTPEPAIAESTPAASAKNNTIQPEAEDESRMPKITNRVAKTTPPGKISRKLSWQLFVTPTISYRTLSENMEYLSAARYNNVVNGGSTVIYPSDVNTMVNHRPDLGFQLGIRSAYPVSKWFSLTGGFQFSVSKYDIKAYQHPTEMATIALRDRSVAAVSRYRNTNGYKESWLRNFYFSASLPIGAELKLSDGTKNYFGIAGTLQPTYVLDNRAYLISSDYKNYAEIPSLTRHWNMNTSFEIFSAHQTGKVKWRIGPQVRYQLMSSFSNNYPIKEHLFDFGLKLGVQIR